MIYYRDGRKRNISDILIRVCYKNELIREISRDQKLISAAEAKKR